MVTVYIEGEDLYVANLGDSEALMGERRPDGTHQAVLLSKKHKPGSCRNVSNRTLPDQTWPDLIRFDLT